MVSRQQVEGVIDPSGFFSLTIESEQPNCYQLGLVFPTGTLADPSDRQGLAQLSLGLLGRRTVHKTREELQRALDRQGAMFDCEALDEYSVVSLIFLPDRKEDCMALFREILEKASFARKDFSKDKKRLLTNFQVLYQDPEYITEVHARASFFGPDHPLSRQSKPRTVRAIRKEECTSWIQQTVTTGPAAVFLSGPVTHNSLRNLFTKHVKGFVFTDGSIPAFPAGTGSENRMIVRKGIHQGYIHILLPVVPRNHRDYLALRLGMYTWAEGGFVSRLMSRLRVELGSTYGIQGQYQTLHGLGYFSLKTSVNLEHLPGTLDIVREEYDRLRNEGITGSEFEDAKNTFINAYPLLWDNLSELGAYLLRQHFLGRTMEEVFTYVERVQKLTHPEVNAALHTLPETIPVTAITVPHESSASGVGNSFTLTDWKDF